MPKYKLTYFNATARAECTRLMFAQAGVEFEDFCVPNGFGPGSEWAKIKHTFPLGQIPVLQVDDLVIPQTGAIDRFVAREFGLYGKNNLEATLIDVAYETVMEMVVPGRYRNIIQEADPTKKAEKIKTFQDQDFPPLAAKVEKLLNQNGGDGYLVGDSPSLADFCYMSIYKDYFGDYIGSKIDDYTKLKALMQRLLELPNIAEYMKKRPEMVQGIPAAYWKNLKK